MITLNRVSLIAIVAVFMIGCGGDEDDDGGGNNTNTGGANGSGGGNGSGGSAGDTAVGCTNTANESLEPTAAGNLWATGVYSYGDGVSTRCLTSPSDGTVCLAGTGAAACRNEDPVSCDYANWGAGIGFALAAGEAPDVVGMDAEAVEITHVQFTLTSPPSVTDSGIRAGLSIVDDPSTTDVDESIYPFILGVDGEIVNNFVADAIAEKRPFEDFTLAPWDAGQTHTLDITKLNSLQFQMVTVIPEAVPYNYCVSDIKFLDANGVEVINPNPIGAGGGGGSGGAGGGGGGAGGAAGGG